MKKLAAIIVTYNPTQDLENHLNELYAQFDQIILVDNASKSEIRNSIIKQIQIRGEKLKTVLNNNNCGVATALNQGFAIAIDLGYDHIIALDQDSIPASGMVEEMMRVCRITSSRQNKIAIIAPKVEDPRAGIIARYLRPKHHFFFE